MNKKLISALGLVTALSLVAPSSHAAGSATAAPGGGTFLSQPIPANVLNAPLFDGTGKKVSLNSYKGQTVVIANFLTSCQEICPMTSANMRQIGDAVAAAHMTGKVTVLEVSVDGWRDSPSRLKAYQALFDDNNWTILGGSTANLNTFWGYFGSAIERTNYTPAEMKKLPVDWQTGKVNTFDISHTDEVVIVGAKQTWSWLDLGNPNPGKATIPAKLKSYLSADGLNNLAKPQEPSWTPQAVFDALKTITGKKIA